MFLFRASPAALRSRTLTSSSAASHLLPLHPLRATQRRSRTTRSAAPMATRTAVDETKGGAFVRTPAGFRSHIGQDGFEPEAGRYHLYISLACPWANRCLAALYLKGLEDAVGVSVVHPTWQRTRPGDAADAHTGWVFRGPGDPPLSSSTGQGSFDCEGCVPDAVNDAASVRDLYEKAADKTGKYSVPVLWDKVKGTVVNNESSEIMRMLNSSFNHLAKHPGVDLYPPHLREAIDAANEWIYPSINNGVYRCGFATKQEPYEEAFRELFAALDRCESILSSQRFVAGPTLTEADVRLFMTLIRFDPVYVVYFKTNRQFIREYPNLREYVKDVHQTHGGAIGRSVNIKHIKTHYFTSHPTLNAHAIIPVGGDAWWDEPHDREAKFPTAKAAQ